MSLLHTDPYVNVTLDDDIVRYTRSSTAYPSIDAVRACNQQIRVAFAALPKGTLAILVDVRNAPPRNDDAFEAEVLEALGALAEQFPVRATLVRTAVGKLQTQRLARARTDSVHIFSDETAALAFLRAREPT